MRATKGCETANQTIRMFALLAAHVRGRGLAAAGRTALFATVAHTRSSRFSALNEEDLTFFRNMLGESAVITDHDSLEPYNRQVVPP